LKLEVKSFLPLKSLMFSVGIPVISVTIEKRSLNVNVLLQPDTPNSSPSLLRTKTVKVLSLMRRYPGSLSFVAKTIALLQFQNTILTTKSRNENQEMPCLILIRDTAYRLHAKIIWGSLAAGTTPVNALGTQKKTSVEPPPHLTMAEEKIVLIRTVEKQEEPQFGSSKGHG
jgi:hypothetical protein